MKPERLDRLIGMLKDLILFLGGLAGIGYQQLTGNVNTVLLIIFTAMTGVPGLTNIISLLRASSINSSSSQQALLHQESASEKSSTNLLGE